MTQLDKLVSHCNRFGFDLYARLRCEKGNIFFSPSSIASVFAMTYFGARGKTAAEIAEAMHFEMDRSRLIASFGELLGALHLHNNDCKLKVANRLWGTKGYAMLPDFLNLIRDSFNSDVGLLDFASNPEAASQTINAWIAEQTDNKIQNIVSSGDVNGSTRLVLTNAVYFHGLWQETFDRAATFNGRFNLAVGQKVVVPFMHQIEAFQFFENDTLQMLGRPYKGNELSMIIILPSAIDGLDHLEGQLSEENISRWLSFSRLKDIEITLPRFRIAYDMDLVGTLSALGMNAVFDPKAADFSGICAQEPLWISCVKHKACIDVNEEGTEAAAATAATMTWSSATPTPPLRFVADHPFVFLIRHEATGSVLFLGRIANPAA